MTSIGFESWRKSGHHFEHRGYQIFYQAAGQPSGRPRNKPNLLCIHGLPTASWDFHRLWPLLTGHFAQLLAPDMIGFGWSEKPVDHRYSIFDQADLHEQLLRKQGITRYRILAHDYGVTVAQELMARSEERRATGDQSLQLEAVCFLNGGLFPESHRPLLIQKLMLTQLGPLLGRAISEKTFAQSLAKVFGPRTKPTPDEMRDFFHLVKASQGRRVMHRLFHYIPERRLHRERWANAVIDSKLPVRLINGPEDPVSGAHLVARYRELVPNADVVILPGIGHYPQVEDPEGVFRACQPILAG